MGKRIQRIFSANIPDKLNELIGFQMVTILKNDKSFKGSLLSYTKNDLKIKLSAYRTQSFAIDTIQEIQIDTISEW